MYRFAIIDNHQSDIDRMINKIHQVYFSKHNMIYECDQYLGCKSFPFDKYYDAIFLDIEMPEMDGFDFAKEINQKYNPRIIFMTNHDNLVMSTFDYKPFHFIQKNIFEESSSHVLELLYNHLFDKVLKVYANSHLEYINQNLVSYISIEDDIVTIHTFNNEIYTSWNSLKSIYDELSSIFSRINQSVIVNMEYIKKINPNYSHLVLKNNITFKITDKYRFTFKKDYMNFRLK